MKLQNGFNQIKTDFPLRALDFTGSLMSLNEELTIEKLLVKFNEFVESNGLIGGLSRVYDPLFARTEYPVESYPEYLYHYTNIGTLGLILQGKSIMLNNLSNVDDLNEGNTRDFRNLGKYCFASCWTDNDRESIPFWNMYTEKMRGVRIKLKANPFKKYKIDLPSDLVGLVNIDENMELLYPSDLLFGDNFIPLPPYNEILKKIVYTDDENILYPQVYRQSKDTDMLKLNELGRCKRSEWSFQREWRYIIVMVPVGIKDAMSNAVNWFDLALDRIQQDYDIGISNIKLIIDDEAFSQMEITLGPMATEGDRLIVEELIDKYNPNAKLFDSVLRGQINIR